MLRQAWDELLKKCSEETFDENIKWNCKKQREIRVEERTIYCKLSPRQLIKFSQYITL
jgi:hypothetical protein